MNSTQIATTKKNHAKDLNIDERITKFQVTLKNEHVYRIPLQYFTDDFRQYLETIMKSKQILIMGAQKTPIQKT